MKKNFIITKRTTTFNSENIPSEDIPVVKPAVSRISPNTVDDVERVYNRVKEFTLIESTNNDNMEIVMAEAIVEYTIIEAFNTLRITNQSKDDVRRMSRHNLNK